MRAEGAGRWEQNHDFGTQQRSLGERRTVWVVLLTVGMMVAEIAAGTVFGSMALLADGWHMATHAAALGIALFAYTYARRHAADPRFSFGTGKVGALGGFASAVGLAVVAVLVLGESFVRLSQPVAIHFDEALTVAVIGLGVNVLSAVLLRGEEPPHAGGTHGHKHHDHNLRGAYLHVVADALTSVLAIGALLCGKLLGWAWLDPAVGILGALVIAQWSFGLVRDTAAVLLDIEVAPERCHEVRQAIEAVDDNRIVDLHLWRVGPRHLAAVVSVVCAEPREPGYYKDLLAPFVDIAHVTVEVHRRH